MSSQRHKKFVRRLKQKRTDHSDSKSLEMSQADEYFKELGEQNEITYEEVKEAAEGNVDMLNPNDSDYDDRENLSLLMKNLPSIKENAEKYMNSPQFASSHEKNQSSGDTGDLYKQIENDTAKRLAKQKQKEGHKVINDDAVQSWDEEPATVNPLIQSLTKPYPNTPEVEDRESFTSQQETAQLRDRIESLVVRMDQMESTMEAYAQSKEIMMKQLAAVIRSNADVKKTMNAQHTALLDKINAMSEHGLNTADLRTVKTQIKASELSLRRETGSSSVRKPTPLRSLKPAPFFYTDPVD